MILDRKQKSWWGQWLNFDEVSIFFGQLKTELEMVTIQDICVFVTV